MIISHLDDLFNEIYEQIRSTDTVQMDVFKSVRKVLIVRSADMSTFKKMIEQLKKVNPHIFVYILTHECDKEMIREICVENYEVIPYVHGRRYEAYKCSQEIQYLREKAIDQYVVLLNDRFGMGFENIIEFARELTCGTVYAFNCYWELMKIPHPELYLKSLELLKAIANWYWADLEGQEKKA
ncbi:Hypothetical protein LUCI_0726 [Lucifera butyrica]|uniref:Uncharacterized protein n=1 Tax=Lucifera butyrica TaxID=1351585 RepID=A0A498QZ98_9FIRM|nr:hypothetical protein [Lucifera butyrica]VBB05516.1 Hypothetical protein LUCI_0726 [Lucifera butyrica]